MVMPLWCAYLTVTDELLEYEGCLKATIICIVFLWKHKKKFIQLEDTKVLNYLLIFLWSVFNYSTGLIESTVLFVCMEGCCVYCVLCCSCSITGFMRFFHKRDLFVFLLIYLHHCKLKISDIFCKKSRYWVYLLRYSSFVLPKVTI